MKLYEITYFLNPDIKEEEVQTVYLQKIKDSISEFSGEVVKEQTVQKKKLAYPIKKSKQGYFGHMLFNLDPKDLKSLDKKLRLEDYILRYLVIIVDNNYLAFMKRQEEEVKEKFQRIIQPSEGQARKPVKSEDKLKLEAEIEKKLEEILEKTQ
mgnify:CR=1 FL=1